MNAIESFSDRLCRAVRTVSTPLCVGIDPRAELLPESILSDASLADYRHVASAYAEFGCALVDIVAGRVAAIKPQAAFFEQLGPPGMEALGQLIDHAVSRDLLVILDGKRNDIGSTAAAYARAYLGRRPHSAWGCDALTINPYMGDDSLEPFVERATVTGSGVFALVKTSNPGSRLFQELECDRRRLYQHVAAWVEDAAAKTAGSEGYGAIGAVVGATHPEHLAELRQTMPHTVFLVPGFGAQGGGAEATRGAFDEQGMGAIINSSRAINFAWRHERYAACASWEDAVEQATLDAIAELDEVWQYSGK